MTNRALLDANLAILLVVGSVDQDYIATHRRLAAFRRQDYGLLSDALSRFESLLFCPNVLTETSNLLRQAGEPRRRQFTQMLRRIIEDSEETFVASVDASAHRFFPELGLTDAALLRIASESTTLLTVDLHLYLTALRQGLPAINFNHLRDPTF
jgi:hypothetical protein